MPFIDPTDLLRIISELYDAPFDVLLESVIGEGQQFADMKDWGTNGSKWGVDENKKHVGSRDFTIDAADIARTAVGGASVSKRGYIFLPMVFAMNSSDGEETLKRMIYDVKKNGSVRVSTWPGYGVEGEGAYPAAVIGHLPAETRSMVQDQLGEGGIIYAVDGMPLSEYMTKPLEVPGEEGDDEWTKIKKWMNPGGEERGEREGGTDYVPPWLMKLSGEIETAIKTSRIKAEISRIKGFQGELILSTPGGDAAMVVSKRYARAAYIFRKKMDVNGSPVDYDVAVSTKMAEFSKEPRKRRQVRTDLTIDDIMAGQAAPERAEPIDQPKKLPRFRLRDWLNETDNGYILRRDVRAEDIRRLIEGGINFEDGRIYSESPMEAESSFLYNLDRVLSEDVIVESEQTIQSFLDVMYSPWSMDEKKLFGYLNTLSSVELDDWVSALEIVVEQGEGDRWVHGLTERSLKELKLSDTGKARIQGILIDLQASPVDDITQGPEGHEGPIRGEPPQQPEETDPTFEDPPSA